MGFCIGAIAGVTIGAVGAAAAEGGALLDEKVGFGPLFGDDPYNSGSMILQ